MADELEEMVPEIGTGLEPKKKIFLAPRYSYKTSVLIAFMAYVFLKYREQGIDASIDYVRASADLAREVLFELKMGLSTNPMIVAYWGDLSKAAYLWSESKINFGKKRDATVSASGLDYGASGRHPDVVIFDDMVNEKNFDSLTAKRKARVKIQAYLPIIPPWGVMIDVGTRFSHNDAHGWLLDQNESNRRKRTALEAEGKFEEAKEFEPKWKEYIRGAWDGKGGKGTLYFPAKLTETFLEYQRQEIEARFFAAWYLNQPYVEGMVLFKPEYLRYFQGHYSPRSADDRLIPTLEIYRTVGARNFVVERVPVRVTMTIDPTTTAKQRSDWTGVTVVATDHRGYWWVLLATHLLEVPSEVGEKCVRWIEQYVPDVVMIESAMADVDMVKRIQQGIHDRALPTTIRSYASQRDEDPGSQGRPGRRKKIARIESLEPRFRRYEIWLYGRNCEALVDQYRHWPDVEHDDVFDALAMQHLIAKKCRWETVEDAEQEMLPEEDDDEPGDMMRSYTTVVRNVDGSSMRITVAPYDDNPDDERLVGRAGLSSQKIRSRRNA